MILIFIFSKRCSNLTFFRIHCVGKDWYAVMRLTKVYQVEITSDLGNYQS